MAAKTGGTRRAPAAVKAAGADVSPAEVQETLIPATPAEVVDPLAASSSAMEVLSALSGVPESVVEEVAAEVVAASVTEPQEPIVLEPVADRSSLLAKFTGAPEPQPTASVFVPEAEPNGAEQTWADGDEPLVAGVVAFDMLRAVVNGVNKQAPKGTTIHASEAVIARGEALGAVVRVNQ